MKIKFIELTMDNDGKKILVNISQIVYVCDWIDYRIITVNHQNLPSFRVRESYDEIVAIFNTRF